MKEYKALRTDLLEKFFLGKGYVIFVSALIFLGHITGLEYYLNFINILVFVGATLFCSSVKPFIAVFLTYTYQISLSNTPSFPVHSGYYLEGERPYLIALMFVVGLSAFFISLYRRGVFSGIDFSSVPMKLSSILLVAALLLNGAFSGEYSLYSTVYGFAVAFSVVGVFYVFYLAFLHESSKDLLEYIVFLSSMIGLIVVLETAHLYIFSDNLISGGSVIKDNVLYGWGIWNNAGQKLTVVIPLIFYGAVSFKNRLFYFICATLCLIAAVFTLSRTALIFATLAYITCLVIACFKGEKKRFYRVSSILLLALGVLLMILLYEKIFSILADYISRGFDDNGRFDLWKYGFDAFFDSPIFGKGFFGLHTDTFISIGFIPQMMHNTPIQLIASMGVFGTCAYIYHRIETLKPFYKKPTLAKSMIFISLVTVLFGSMVENFVFYVEPMFYFSVLLALAFRIYKEECEAE